jgi:hypothetical protein
LTNYHSIAYVFIKLMLINVILSVFSGTIHCQADSTLLIKGDSTYVYNSEDDNVQKKEKERIVAVDNSMGDDPIFYSAKDSIYTDLRTKKIYLYAEAKITFGTTVLTAAYMEIDLELKEVRATYTLDEEGKRVGEPLFVDGGQEVKASSIRFNFETKKAKIEETRIQQDESFLFMETAKRHANEEMHFRNGRFSTCDLDYPHFHFHLSKAVLVPEKRIVTGPANLWINGVPTPLALPFGFFPTSSAKKKGIIFPQIIPVSQNGFGIQDLGFYTPLGDNYETTTFGTLFSRGSWGFGNLTNYNVRYKYQGSARVDFLRLKRPFPSPNSLNKFTVNWMHNQDAKANPYWRFAANVNFVSDNNTQTTLDPMNTQVFNNALMSSMTLNRSFPGKPYNLGMKVGANQNSQTGNTFLDLPSVNFTMSRVFPFKFLRKQTTVGAERWFEKIGLTYNMDAKNTGNVNDSMFSSAYSNMLLNQFQNGVKHNVAMTTTLKAFNGTLNFTPSVTYNNFWNFQAVNQRWDGGANQVVYDSLSGFFTGQDLSIRINATNSIYSMYRMIGLKDVRFRNVTRPSVGFSYIPDLGQHRTEFAGQNGALVTYSPYDRSLYREGPGRSQGLITFGLNSVTDMKMPSKRDSTGVKRIGLIEGFTLNGNYDLLKDSMNLSDLNMQLRLKPMSFFSIVASSNFSPYDWVDSTGRYTKDLAIQTRGELGRFTTFNVNSIFTFTSKEGQKILSETEQVLRDNWNQDFDYFVLHPHEVIDFRIPWKINLSHTINWRRNLAITPMNPDLTSIVQTIAFTGELSLTPRWLIATRGTFDIKGREFTTVSVDIHRNLHCWKMSFYWIPVGFNKSFMLRIAGNANMLRDVKWEFRKPPMFM